MSYLVLARKYRPQNFAELVGQEHITKSFSDALNANRLGHAFLFCGPRGIGKTSCARILAKSLNCEQGPTLTPCGVCAACKEIAQGTSFDVIEIDAASNRGIDEIRTLRDNVKFAPNSAKFKIYIIDEVHMLTTEAFNALLKTLEEPPSHVKFILATTESHKIPATILSRCQRFDFKRIAVEMIIGALKNIAAKENVTVEDEALFAIAKASQGSMRDALSILDQLSSFGSHAVKAGDVYSMLGLVETDLMFALIDALIAKDCVAALNVFDQLIDRGKDIRQLGRDLTEYYRHLMIVKVGGPSLNELIDLPKLVKQRLAKQADGLSLPMIIKSMDIFIDAQDTARVLENWRMPFEIAFAKLTYVAPQGAVQSVPAAAVQSTNVTPPPVQATVASSKHVAPKPASAKPANVEQAPLSAKLANVEGNLSLDTIVRNWNALTHDVSQQKISLGSYLLEGGPAGFKDGKLIIGFPKGHEFAKEMLESKDNIAFIEKLFSNKLGSAVRIELAVVAALVNRQPEVEVEKALETFGGQVVQEWHNE